jgi:hypothetical protein
MKLSPHETFRPLRHCGETIGRSPPPPRPPNPNFAKNIAVFFKSRERQFCRSAFMLSAIML